jgi:hypothetical protein
MSTRNTPIRCTSCDFESVLVHSPISLVYQLPNGEEFIAGRRFGWCSSCNGIRNIEPDFSHYFNSGQRIAELNRIVNSAKFRAWKIVEQLLCSPQSPEENELHELKMGQTIANARKGSPRCLSCESIEVVEVLGTTAHVHTCGGRLVRGPMRANVPSFNYRHETIYLNYEGLKVDRFIATS